MSRIRRLLGWAVFLGFLFAVGVVVFVFVRHTPRCSIAGPLAYQHHSTDGSRLVTLRAKEGLIHRGPLQLWDTHSGGVIREWFDGAELLRFQISPDERRATMQHRDGRLWIVDYDTGKEWCFDEPRDEVNRAEFSPKGRWLFVVTARCDVLYVIDPRACEVVLRIKDNWPLISPDDRRLFYREGKDRKFTVWDMDAGKALGVIDVTADRSELSADGRFLLERHSEPVAREVEIGEGPFKGTGMQKIERLDDRISVWDLATLERRFDHRHSQAGHLQAMLSADGNLLAVWLQDDKRESKLELIETATGKVRWTHPVKHVGHFDFSPDGALCYLECGPDEKNSTLTLLDTATGRPLWHTRSSGWALTRFVGNAGVIIHQEDIAKPLLFRDVRTGAQLATAPADFRTANCMPMLTPDKQRYIICGWQERQRDPYFWEARLEKLWPEVFGDELEGALVMEAATGRELFRVVNRGKMAHELSEDGHTLITVDPSPGPEKNVIIRIWDLGTARAWLWAVGVAAATGFGLIAIRWAWQRRKARKAMRANASVPGGLA